MNLVTIAACILLGQLIYLVQCLPLPKDKDKENKESNGKKPEKLKKAARYLFTFGYTGKDFSTDDPTEDVIASFLRNFQQYAAIPVTGKLDNKTVAKMDEPRCGMKDPRFQIKPGRSKRYVRQGNDWLHKLTDSDRTLTWKIVSGGRIGKELMRRVMYDSFEMWSKAANVKFREVPVGDADLLVSFSRGYHQDPYPFDGRGGTLAHAFYPFPGAEISGDIHFDNDEDFTYKKNYGTDIMWVAVHEAGHSLGLDHSDSREAIMYPWYSGSTGNEFDLTDDDVRGMQSIYGAPPTEPPTTTKATTTTTLPPTTKRATTTTTKPPTTTKATTTTTTTAKPPMTTKATTTAKPSTTTKATTTNTPPRPPSTESPTTKEVEPVTPPNPATTRSTEAPKTKPPTTKEVEPVTPPNPVTTRPTEAPKTKSPTTKEVEPVTPPKPVTTPSTVAPATTKKSFGGCIPRIDAAVVAPTGWVYVFSGKSFFLISKSGREYGPLGIKDYFSGLSETVTAAYKQSDNSLVLFAGANYYVYHMFQKIDGPKPVTDFGLPSGTRVDAALVWNGNQYAKWFRGEKVYLFSGKIYYRFNVRTNRIDSGYPKNIAQMWRGLPAEVDAAFSGYSIQGYTWPTHFISKDKYYIFNDRRVRIEPRYPEPIKDLLKC